MYILPFILEKTETKYDNIYTVIVDFTDQEKELNSETENTFYILKEVPVQNKSSHLIEINPFYSEAMVSHTFNNPFLNRSKFCCLTNGKLQLFSDKASGTCRSIKNNSLPRIKKWFNSLIQGVSHLHYRRLIHGDIKGTNVLIVDDDVKLADFGMVTLILENNYQTFPNNVKMYTVTHRPPEVWKGNVWGFSADIWALGCTFFEILYGHSLFPVQESDQAYINCLNQWSTGSYTFPPKWNTPENQVLNELILKMLNPNPNKRPSIFELVNYSFEKPTTLSISPPDITLIDNLSFAINEPVSSRHYSINFVKPDKLRSHLEKNIINFIQSENRVLIDIIAALYEYASESSSKLSLPTLRACSIIIYSIAYRSNPPFMISTHDDICEIMRISQKTRFNYINFLQIYRIPT